MNIEQIIKLLWLRQRLRSRDRWSRQQLELYKHEGLRDLREYTYANSPFYKRFHSGLENSPLEELPVLTKAELMKNWDAIVTDRSLKLAEVQAFLANLTGYSLFKNKYNINSTAGSTGLRGIFIYDPKEWVTVLASYARANDWSGVRVGLTRRLKVAIVSTTTPSHQSAAVGATLQSWFVPTLRIDSTEPMKNTVARLNSFQPQSLVAYANMARLLAQEQLAGSLRISPEAVFCASEVLTEDSRRLINRAWGVQPFNVYGATETGGIASECPQHRGLHLYEDLVIAEVVDEQNRPVKPGEYGVKILATVLFSRTLPIIRYEISDSVRLSPQQCPCGRPFALIDDIQGRIEEVIYLRDESSRQVPIQPIFFYKLMEALPVAGWQIVQDENNLLRILILNPSGNFKEAALVTAISMALAEQGIHKPLIKVEHVRALTKTALGKTFLIKSLR